MTNEQTQEPGFTVEEIGEHFGRLLGQMFALQITLTKQVGVLKADNAALSLEIERLRQDLRQAQTDLLAAQDSKVINNE